MESSAADGVATNTCSGCRSIWITGESLSQLIKMQNSEFQMSTFVENRKFADASDRKCPSCEDNYLSLLNVKEVEVDMCQFCNGVFLDSGEMEKIFPEAENSAATSGRLDSRALILDVIVSFFAFS